MSATRLNPEYQPKGTYVTRTGGSTCTNAEMGTNEGYAGQLMRFVIDNRGDTYVLAITSTAIELYKGGTRLWSK